MARLCCMQCARVAMAEKAVAGWLLLCQLIKVPPTFVTHKLTTRASSTFEVGVFYSSKRSVRNQLQSSTVLWRRDSCYRASRQCAAAQPGAVESADDARTRFNGRARECTRQGITPFPVPCLESGRPGRSDRAAQPAPCLDPAALHPPGSPSLPPGTRPLGRCR